MRCSSFLMIYPIVGNIFQRAVKRTLLIETPFYDPQEILQNICRLPFRHSLQHTLLPYPIKKHPYLELVLGNGYWDDQETILNKEWEPQLPSCQRVWLEQLLIEIHWNQILFGHRLKILKATVMIRHRLHQRPLKNSCARWNFYFLPFKTSSLLFFTSFIFFQKTSTLADCEVKF